MKQLHLNKSPQFKTDNSIQPGPDSGIGAGTTRPIPANK